MLSRCVVVVCLLLLSRAAIADSFDINMNNNSAQIKFGTSAGGLGDGNAEPQVGVLYNDQNNILAEAGIKAKGGGGGEEGAPGLIAGGWGGVVLGSVHQGGITSTVSCIAIGPEIGVALPTAVPIALVAEYRAALKIMSFFDSERLTQLGVRLEVASSPNAKIYFGYREISFGIKGAGSATLDMGTYMGVTATFE